ncbi:hypothetical protein [Runella sp.]|uniref:hypothetical protein n=1 Tax=Runella sp. TaxID=1960881 RepID=UPI002607B193|nr:hypothetical protein [Runella sp.]
MKKVIFLSILIHAIYAYKVFSQSAELINNFLFIKGNSDLSIPAPTGDSRTFLKLRNNATVPASLVSIELSSGSSITSTLLSHHAREYDYAGNQFSGFGQLYSKDNGLILRSGSPQNPNGMIKFMTGNQVPGNFSLERMRIDMIGNVGIGTQQPKLKLQVTEGDVYIENPNRGIILKSPNGGCWRVTIDDTGNFVRTGILCP